MNPFPDESIITAYLTAPGSSDQIAQDPTARKWFLEGLKRHTGQTALMDERVETLVIRRLVTLRKMERLPKKFRLSVN